MVAYPLGAFRLPLLRRLAIVCISLLHLPFNADKNAFRSRHEILATGCLRVPAMASILFRQEAYRAAFDFDLEEEGLFFCDADLVCALDDFALDVFVLVDFAAVRVVLVCSGAETVCAADLLREPLPRTRVPGASFTCSATTMVRPGEMVLAERWFQRRSSSTETPKRSATVMSVSPRRTV